MTQKHNLLYAAPEEVGVSSQSLLQLLDRLELENLEPHGLIMARHGKIFAEGFWQPFSPLLIHGMQSLSKTYTATAIGLAFTEGLLSLDEKIVDLFPEYRPCIRDSRISEITVYHLLTMTAGLSEIPGFDGDWIANFFSSSCSHAPGSHFFYNSVCSTLLGAIIRRKTGLGLQAYLSEKLCAPLKMDETSMKWLCLRDGLEIGGSGLYTTMYNNLKLAQLYLSGGEYEGTQLLSREYVRLATTLRVTNGNFSDDGTSGYGFQMWMCGHPHAFRMDGAMGQYAIVLPAEDMIILYTGTLQNGSSDKRFFSLLWEFIAHAFNSGSENPDTSLSHYIPGYHRTWDVPENQSAQYTPEIQQAQYALENRLARLALAPQPFSSLRNPAFSGTYRVTRGLFHAEPLTGGIMQDYYPPRPVSKFRLFFDENTCQVTLHTDSEQISITAGMDGLPRLNRIRFAPYPVDKLLCGALFPEPSVLELRLRWVETCFSFRLLMTLTPEGLLIEKRYSLVSPEPTLSQPIRAERL